MVVVGVPETQIPVGAFPLIIGRRSLAGSMIGSIAETQEMLDFCSKRDIAIDQVNDAFERVIRSDVRFRFVIDMRTL